MPLYEYQCDGCGHRFERIQKFSDPPVDTCPSCGQPVRRLVSSPAFQFKGSGWYITDYARAGKAAGEGGDAKAADKADKADKTEAAGKADAKPSSDSTSAGSDAKPAAGKADKVTTKAD